MFKPGINFRHVLDLYSFDRQLRLLTLDALERIEIALRTALSNELAVRHNPWWYLDTSIFKPEWQVKPFDKLKAKSPRDSLCDELNTICNNKRQDEEIRRYYFKYGKPKYPPSWIVLEFLSFGKCTSLFRYLRFHQDKAAISDIFSLHPKIFESSIEPLRYIRNLCAHHSRLWDRWFVYKPRGLEELKKLKCESGSLKEQLALLDLLHSKISPESTWKEKLFSLFDRYKKLPLDFSLSGFQIDWQNDPFWNVKYDYRMMKTKERACCC